MIPPISATPGCMEAVVNDSASLGYALFHVPRKFTACSARKGALGELVTVFRGTGGVVNLDLYPELKP